MENIPSVNKFDLVRYWLANNHFDEKEVPSDDNTTVTTRVNSSSSPHLLNERKVTPTEIDSRIEMSKFGEKYRVPMTKDVELTRILVNDEDIRLAYFALVTSDFFLVTKNPRNQPKISSILQLQLQPSTCKCENKSKPQEQRQSIKKKERKLSLIEKLFSSKKENMPNKIEKNKAEEKEISVDGCEEANNDNIVEKDWVKRLDRGRRSVPIDIPRSNSRKDARNFTDSQKDASMVIYEADGETEVFPLRGRKRFIRPLTWGVSSSSQDLDEALTMDKNTKYPCTTIHVKDRPFVQLPKDHPLYELYIQPPRVIYNVHPENCKLDFTSSRKKQRRDIVEIPLDVDSFEDEEYDFCANRKKRFAERIKKRMLKFENSDELKLIKDYGYLCGEKSGQQNVDNCKLRLRTEDVCVAVRTGVDTKYRSEETLISGYKTLKSESEVLRFLRKDNRASGDDLPRIRKQVFTTTNNVTRRNAYYAIINNKFILI